MKFHIDSVHVLEENATPDPHHDFTLAAHMKNILLEKDSVHGNQGSQLFSWLHLTQNPIPFLERLGFAKRETTSIFYK